MSTRELDLIVDMLKYDSKPSAIVEAMMSLFMLYVAKGEQTPMALMSAFKDLKAALERVGK